jgi:myo-inositol-1(or 4)-monophosphatase
MVQAVRDYARELDAMTTAARAAGAGLAADFRRLGDLHVVEKAPSDFVSSADLAAQATIVEHLRAVLPDVAILGEEGVVGDAEADRRFVVDPLDGTTNFCHGIPHFAISIAFEIDGVAAAALVFDPCRDEMFTAISGGGCFLGNTRLSVSSRRALSDAVVATGVPHRGRGDHAAYLPTLAAVMAEASGIRRFGAAALDLAYVAAGRFDAYFESALFRWDVAAGVLLVREAGGRVTDLGGRGDPSSTGNILATNGHLHAHLEALLS